MLSLLTHSEFQMSWLIMLFKKISEFFFTKNNYLFFIDLFLNNLVFIANLNGISWVLVLVWKKEEEIYYTEFYETS
jgi:hypothetical protein